MNREFLRAIVDTLIPGETAPGEAGLPALPSGSAAGVDLAPYVDANREVLRAIAARAGGEGSFTAADEAARVRVLQSIEREQLDAFRALVSLLLQDYYETDLVLAAMGWRADPPQPRGHLVSTNDQLLPQLSTKSGHRSKMWR